MLGCLHISMQTINPSQKNTPTLHKDGFRRVRCKNPKCRKYIGNAKNGKYLITSIGATRPMVVVCRFCHYKFTVDPPKRGTQNNLSGYWWGGDQMSSTFTADQSLTHTE